jgi:hypothetical protein
MSTPRRDELVGSALRELGAPEHRPRFWADLDRALQSAAPRPVRLVPSPPRTRPAWLRLAIAAAALAALAGIVVGIPRTDTPEPALAEVVSERVAEAVEGLETLSGRALVRSRPPLGEPGTTRMTFALTARGSFRSDIAGLPDVRVYDAVRGVERSINSSASLGGVGRFYSLRTGLAPGPPDAYVGDDVLPRQLGAAVRGLLAANDPRIEVTTYAGRPAWKAVLRVDPNAIVADFDRLVVVVDQQLGLPVRARTSLEGRFHSELRLRRLELNEQLPKGTFDLEFPPDAEVSRVDEGFRRVPLDRVEVIAGYPPVLPVRVPEGYSLADLALARRPPWTGTQAANPRSRDVVSLTYRRGFDRFTVTTRREGDSRSRVWSDPVAAGEGLSEEPRRLTLRDGAFAGARAELIIGPRSVPHLWGISDGLVFTIAGDLTADELIAVAESLE